MAKKKLKGSGKNQKPNVVRESEISKELLKKLISLKKDNRKGE